MTVSADNLSGRLWTLFTEGKTLPRNLSVHDAWTKLLKVEHGRPLLMRRLARVIEMPGRLVSDLRDAVSLDEFDDRLHLGWQGPVEAALGVMNLGQSWDNSINQITGETLQSLEWCDHILHRRRPGRVLKHEDLDSIRQELQSLLAELDDSSIEKTVADLIRRHLRLVLEAVEDYDVVGTAPLEYALQAAAGTMYVNYIVYQQAAEREKGALEKFLAAIGHAAAIVDLTFNLLQLPAPIRDFIPQSHQIEAPTDSPTHPEAQALPRDPD